MALTTVSLGSGINGIVAFAILAAVGF